MIIGYHIAWTTYGHSFPTASRMSWSGEAWKPELAALGEIDRVDSVEERQALAKERLKSPAGGSEALGDVVHLNAEEAKLVLAAIDEVAETLRFAVRSSAVLSDHLHIVVDQSRTSCDRFITRLKARTARVVRDERVADKTVDRRNRDKIWSPDHWCQEIDNTILMDRAVQFVQLRAGGGSA